MIELTGRPFTASLPAHESVYDTVQIGIAVPRPELADRIERRVHRMWRAGLVDEVRRLEAEGLREGRTAARALGYQQVLAFLAERVHGSGSPGRDREGHQEVRAAAGDVVPARRARALDQRLGGRP